MTPEEREQVVEALPSEFEPSEAHPPEGDRHFEIKSVVRQTLRGFFERKGRRVYVVSELPVYYPDESMFAPDVMAVTDVELHPHDSWVVSREGKGLDLVMEIHVKGRRTKDTRDNLARCARLGVPEYFVFDLPRTRLLGYRLVGKAYEPIIPQQGRWPSQVLGLDLAIKDGRPRFFQDLSLVPEARELIAQLGGIVDELVAKKEEAERQREETERQREEAERQREEAVRQREEAQRQREEAQRQRDEAQARAAAAEAELARLRAELEKKGRS
ncbi:MAG: Uma2 family endonuclease [Myxococcota bacterium]